MYTDDFISRFEQKFDKTEGCWTWKASKAGQGYGQIKLPKQRRQAYAHRVAYEIYKGPIPAGQYVCHACDNPECVNPDHLFLGSSHDNHADMKEKGRHTYGEKSATRKLTENQVLQIRSCLAAGMTQMQIARAFGVQQMTISRINTGKRWAHVK